jgi:hypothetical protein
VAGCVWCGDTPTTKEHVFPQSLLEVIPGRGRIMHSWMASPGRRPETRGWIADTFTFKASVVCQDRCNGGWMARLDERARPFLKPMIRGRNQTLFPEGAQIIAYWALKTVMMIDLAQETKYQTVPETNYSALFAAKDVLPGTSVWLGTCSYGAGALARYRTLYFDFNGTRVGGFGATLSLGHLVVEVIRVENRGEWASRVVGKLREALRPLWPYLGVVKWPTPALLSLENVRDIAEIIEVRAVKA